MSGAAVRYWRESRRSGPNAYYEVKPTMPRIYDVHLQVVAFVYGSKGAAQEGRQAGGTAVIVNYPSNVGDFRHTYVITNEHVVDQGGHWIRLNRVGGTHIVHIPGDQWIWAPNNDDFALAPLPVPEGVIVWAESLDLNAVTREEAQRLKVGPGDEVYMVGRFIGHGGRVTNNPVARFGNIALMPNDNEPVRDGRHKDVIAYLVEMRSHAGFSGSPVFLHIRHNSFRGLLGDTSMDDWTTRFRLLGIDTGHIVDRLEVRKVEDGGSEVVPSMYAVHESNMAIVAPIWKVVDLLEREDLVEARDRAAREFYRVRGHAEAVSDSAVEHVTSTAGGEFERFERLTERLMNVSKSELDEKLRGQP